MTMTVTQVLETTGVKTTRCDDYMFDPETYEYSNYIIRTVVLPNGEHYGLVDVPISTKEQLDSELAYGPFDSSRRAYLSTKNDFS